MAEIANARLLALLAPFYPEISPELLDRLSTYLDLLVKWNARTNLTAIRTPEEMVLRHFGESLFLASVLPACTTLLDLGSGAGFPGVPVQLARPEVRVTLAESQGKKAAFLLEVVRVLELPTEVWAARAETLLPGRRFDVVCLRAVDDPEKALALARRLAEPDGWVAHLTTEVAGVDGIRVPGSGQGVVHLFHVEQS